MISTDTIIAYLEEQTRDNQIIDIDLLMRAATKLNILIGDEHNRLFELQQEVARITAKHIAEGMSVNKADNIARASDTYLEMSKQKARIAQIEEFIRLAKLQAKLKSEELRNQ